MSPLLLLAAGLAAPPGDPPAGVVVTLGSPALRAADGCRAVGFSPDGKEVAVFSPSGVRRWDLATGRPTLRAEKSICAVKDRVFPTPDGRRAVVVETDSEKWGTIRVIDAATGEKLASSKPSENPDEITVSDDAAWVAVEANGNTRVHPAAGGERLVRFEKLAEVRRFAAAPDGKVFAFCTTEGAVTVRFPDAPPFDLPPPTDGKFTAVALAPDGRTLAVASYTSDDSGKKVARPVELWDLAARKVKRVLPPADWFGEYPNRLRFTPDGKTVLAGDGGYIRGWDAATGKRVFAAEPSWGWAGPLQVSPDGRHLAVAYGPRPMVWDLAAGAEVEALRGHTGPVWELAFTRDGRRAATSAYGREEVYVWDARTGKPVVAVRAAFGKPNRLAGRPVPGRVRVGFSFDGTKLVTVNDASGAPGPVRVWDATTGKLLWEKPVSDRFAPEAVFTRHGLFVTAGETPTLLDAATGQPIWSNPKNKVAVLPVVSPNGERIAFEAGPVVTTVIEAGTGREVDRFPGVPTAFAPDGGAVAFAPDNYTIRHRFLGAKGAAEGVHVDREGAAIVLSPDTRLAAVNVQDSHCDFRVLDARDGTPVSTCKYPARAEGTDPVPVPSGPGQVAFSPDGRTLAAIFPSFGTVLWEAATGAVLAEYPPGTGNDVKAFGFAPDSRTLFAAQSDGEVGGPVLGWDVTCGAWGPQPKPAAAELAKLTADLGGKAPAARRAVYRLAADPAAAVALAKGVTRPPTAADVAAYKRWVADLDAPAFADREAARKGLAAAGWRAEPLLRAALAETTSAEVRARAEALLAKPDARPVRAVHLLELVGTPEALAVLREVAAGPAETLAVREAKRTLDRLK